MRWKAVVFDLDDTLYAEADFVRSGFRAVSRHLERVYGLPAEGVFSRLDSLFRRGVRGNTFQLLAEELNIEALDVAALVSEYRNHQPDIQPFPGIADLLGRLSGRVPLGLISDGYHEVQARKLAALGLEGSFDAVLFTDLYGREHWKPHPLGFRKVLERLAVEPDKSVYIADNPRKDFIGARRAGMDSIRCLYSSGDYCRLPDPSPEHTADHVVETLAELEHLLFESSSLPADRPVAPSSSTESLHG